MERMQSLTVCLNDTHGWKKQLDMPCRSVINQLELGDVDGTMKPSLQGQLDGPVETFSAGLLTS